MILFELLFLFGLAIGVLIRVVYMSRYRKTGLIERRTSFIDRSLIFLSVVGGAAPLVYLFTPWLDRFNYQQNIFLGWLGVPIFFFGFWLLWRSHTDLGKNWAAETEIKEGHQLVIHGVYKKLRHPMYSAHLFWAVGQLLLIPNRIVGPLMLPFIILFCVYRINMEEKFLLEKLGEEYKNYSKKTWRVLPFI